MNCCVYNYISIILVRNVFDMPIKQSVISEEEKRTWKKYNSNSIWVSLFHLRFLITKNIDEPQKELPKKCNLVQLHANETETEKLSNAAMVHVNSIKSFKHIIIATAMASSAASTECANCATEFATLQQFSQDFTTQMHAKLYVKRTL